MSLNGFAENFGPAVVFEDGYRDRPGADWVARRSTSSTLTIRASGGLRSATLDLSAYGLYKLVDEMGLSIDLDSTVSIPAGEVYSRTYTCFGGLPSVSARDRVRVSGTLVAEGAATTPHKEAELTVVRVALEAVYAAPENPFLDRHVYGVGEQVKFTVTPALADVKLKAVKGDTEDHQTQYDTFGGQSEVDGSAERTYTCPIASTYTPDVTVSYGAVEYRPQMALVEPQLIVTQSATASGWFWPGQVGMGCLRTVNYIGPMDVSFKGVRVAEIPCTNTILPEGWFATTNYTGRLSHDYYAGAGALYSIRDGNYWMVDDAGRDTPYPNWSAGRLTWKIPIGWKRLRYAGDDSTYADTPDYLYHMRENSRPLLIGNREDAYLQVFNIDANGMASVEKFGYRLQRPRLDFSGNIIKTGVQ